MRRAAAVDANQPAIVKELRQAGLSVQHLHTIGKGCPDILVGHPFSRCNFLFEIKDPAKPPSKRVLTHDEYIWHDDWYGQVDIIETADEALAIIARAQKVYR